MLIMSEPRIRLRKYQGLSTQKEEMFAAHSRTEERLEHVQGNRFRPLNQTPSAEGRFP